MVVVSIESGDDKDRKLGNGFWQRLGSAKRPRHDLQVTGRFRSRNRRRASDLSAAGTKEGPQGRRNPKTRRSLMRTRMVVLSVLWMANVAVAAEPPRTPAMTMEARSQAAAR